MRHPFQYKKVIPQRSLLSCILKNQIHYFLTVSISYIKFCGIPSSKFKFMLEVCTDPARLMRVDFFILPGQQNRNQFYNNRAGLHEKKKTRRIILRTSECRQNKDKVFKWRLNINNELYLFAIKCKCINQTCLSVFITGL